MDRRERNILDLVGRHLTLEQVNEVWQLIEDGSNEDAYNRVYYILHADIGMDTENCDDLAGRIERLT